MPSLRGASGIATYTVSLVDGLASAGHEVVLLDQSDGYRSEDPLVTVVPLRPPRPLPDPVEPFAEWGLRGEVRRAAREFEVDGIHATRLGLVPRGERVVITAWDPIASPLGRFRSAQQRGEPRVKEAAFAAVDAIAARRSAAIVAVTSAVRDGVSVFRRRCELIPPFLPDEAISTVAASRPHDVVMVAGAVDLPRKGLDLALEAVGRARRSLADARLVLVGDWIDSARRDSLPEFCDVRGRLSAADLGAVLAGAGCCLIPSFWEEFGYAGLEALAAGIPVACTPMPGFEGLSGGGVFMAGERDPDQLAGRIEAALTVSDFEFPRECRRSVAIPRLLELYGEAFAAS